MIGLWVLLGIMNPEARMKATLNQKLTEMGERERYNQFLPCWVKCAYSLCIIPTDALMTRCCCADTLDGSYLQVEGAPEDKAHRVWMEGPSESTLQRCKVQSCTVLATADLYKYLLVLWIMGYKYDQHSRII